MQEFDLSELIDEVKEEVHGIIKADQEIIVKGPSITLSTDPHILKNILLNLVSNAIKYSSDEGKIKLTVGKEERTTIAIQDHGIGIPKKDQDMLFERFHRAENVVNIQGTGLGLHIVKKYVELLHGTITFDSIEGEGSTFRITLP